MKKVYRHIGYFEGQDAMDMFCNHADSIVSCIEAGPFHTSDGESETDIENLDDEHDQDLFYHTSDKQYLVRYTQGSRKPIEGWFIDVYRLMEVESDDQEAQDDLIEEYCEHCCEYVNLTPEFKVHTCPECGKSIVACNLCPYLPEEAKCATCPLAKQAEIQNECKDAGVASTVQTFAQSFNKCDIKLREQGFEIVLEIPHVGMTTYTLIYDSKYDHCKLFRRYAGGNSYTFAGSGFGEKDLALALRLVSGTNITIHTPIHVRQLK